LAGLAFGQAGDGRATLSAVGDIRLDGPVGELIRRFGPAHPTSGLGGALHADIVLGNLECSVTRRGKKLAKTWNFRAPPENLSALKKAGFTLVTIANNHSFDYGREGFLDTLNHLNRAKLPHIGGGENRAAAERLRVVDQGGLKIGFLGLTSTHPEEAWAGKSRPGVAYSDFARFPAVIAAAREMADVLIVVFHGGTELAAQPNDIQKAFGRAAVEAGADLVIGHHPHVVQPIEIYRGKPILYSLGNFLFVSPNPATRDTVVARAVLTKGGVESIDFVPLDTNWGRPIPASIEKTEVLRAALDGFGALSAEPKRFRVTPLPEIR
jgi:poly-gamma-glutamate synthesis protein (capsule biosynthesis protein)